MPDQAERSVNITRGLVDSLTFYEVTEDELEILENGPTSTIYLNVSIALLSVGISTLTSMVLNSVFPNVYVFAGFLVVTIVSLILGIVFAIVWYRSRGSYATTITRIKNRLPKGVNIEPAAAVLAPIDSQETLITDTENS
jgi:hypothetical protein